MTNYRLAESKYEKYPDGCLYLEIELNRKSHVIFTGSSYLIQSIKQIPKESLPFTTTIVEEDERYVFT